MPTNDNNKKNTRAKKAPAKPVKPRNQTPGRKIKASILKNSLVEAMRKNLGNVTKACLAVPCERSTFYDYYNEDPEFKKRIDDLENVSLDFAEGKLMELIGGYQHEDLEIFIHRGKPIKVPVVKVYPPDKTSIIFYLKTKGKKRGYIETSEVINKNVKADPFEGMTEEEIDAELARLEEEEDKLAKRVQPEKPEAEEETE